MINASMLTRICEITNWIYVENTTMRNVFIIELISSIIAIFAISIILFAMLINRTLHFNMRLLLICLCGAFILTSIDSEVTGTLLDSVYYLIAIGLKKGVERCAWLLFKKSECIALRNVYYFGVIIIFVSTLFLSVERIIATILYRTYERITRRWISILMAFFQWSLIIPLIYYQDEDIGYIFPYCAYELFNPRAFANIELGVIAIQIFSFVTTIILWIYNSKQQLLRKSQNKNLSIQYQLRENVSTAKIMVAIISLTTIPVLSNTFLYFVSPYRKNDNYWKIVEEIVVYSFFAEIQACFTSVTAILFAVVVCLKCKAIQSSLFHVIGLTYCTKLWGKNSVNAVPDDIVCRTYFDQLHHQWGQHHNLPLPFSLTRNNDLQSGITRDLKFTAINKSN
ncbi:unnamed protein product [Thelazia callipaeda]|uniref:G_PROTEIN_RECEP_F1_2 domain-containing protein n=1 Tax=Thelazia callipaeda TaxID=103827 RepID=A0A0N5D1T1_THECL|nr:unnamed protein product [Thelazia callipaeda]